MCLCEIVRSDYFLCIHVGSDNFFVASCCCCCCFCCCCHSISSTSIRSNELRLKNPLLTLNFIRLTHAYVTSNDRLQLTSDSMTESCFILRPKANNSASCSWMWLNKWKNMITNKIERDMRKKRKTLRIGQCSAKRKSDFLMH